MFWLRVIYVVVVIALAIGQAMTASHVTAQHKRLDAADGRIHFLERHTPVRWKKVGDDSALSIEIAVDPLAELEERVAKLEEAAGQRPQEE
jgi:hypothetical protein